MLVTAASTRRWLQGASMIPAVQDVATEIGLGYGHGLPRATGGLAADVLLRTRRRRAW